MIWKLLAITVLAVGAMSHSIPARSRGYDRVKKQLTDFCEVNGAQDKLEDAQKAATDYLDCINEVLDIDNLGPEINAAQEKGEFKPLVTKYCGKVSSFKTCLRDLTVGIAPCMEEQMRNYIPQSLNATYELLDYICYNDGERANLFLSDASIGCFTRKRVALQKCVEDMGHIDHQKSLTLSTAERCNLVNQLSSCTVNTLKECSSTSLATTTQEAFKILLKSLPCPGTVETTTVAA